MTLLRLISWPYFRRHILRTLLTTAGIVLGVSLFVGMTSANQSVLSGFAETLNRIAGKTQLQISAGDAGFAEDVLERVQDVSTVAVAAPVIEVIVNTRLSQSSLLILGIDMTGDRSLREYDFDDSNVVDDPLIFLAQPDSLILSREFATRYHLASGNQVMLSTAAGQKAFTIRGLMKSTGLASAFGGNLAVMDIYAAQKMFGRGRTFDRIDVALKPGTSVETGQQRLREILGPAFEVLPPSGRGQQFTAMLAGYSTVIRVSSAFALFIAMFIIYNAFSVAVSQRRREIGILRALGASRAQIQMMFLSEGLCLGVIGASAGLVLGLLMSHGIAMWTSALIADIYRVEPSLSDTLATPSTVALAFLIGVVTSVIAAAFPAFQASQVDPVIAMQKGRLQVLGTTEVRTRTAIATVLSLFSLAGIFATESRPAFYAGYACAIAAALLMVPVLTLVLIKILGPGLKWIRPVEGALVADSFVQTPRRTSTSISALMLSLALSIGFQGMARANFDSIADWTNVVLNPDLFVLPSLSLDMRGARFPPVMAGEIAQIPGVERVQMLRNVRVPFRGGQVMVLAMEMNSIAQTVRRTPIAGELSDMYRRAAAGEGVIVSDNLAQLQHLKLGETIELSAPGGLLRLPIVGIIVDYSDQQGAILLDRAIFTMYWRDDSTNMFRVYTTPGSSPAAVREQITSHFAGTRDMFILTNAEFKEYVLRLAGRWFDLTSIQIAIAVFVAVLGIVNALIVSIMDRRRELAVLRAIGARHGEIRRTIWLEALTMGFLGLVLGAVLGALNLYYILSIVNHDLAGMRLDYVFPSSTMLALIPIILIAAFTASLWPAESAVRSSLMDGLAYE